MPDELNPNLPDVQDDDPTASDETTPKQSPAPTEELDDAALAAALKTGKQEAPTGEQPTEPPKPADATPTEPPKNESPKPAIDIEAELEKRLQAKMAEAEQRYQQDKQRAIDAVTARHKKQEDAATRKLRDFQAATGMDVDKALVAHRERAIDTLQVEQGMTAEAARAYVAAQEKAALYEAREAERQREHEESVKSAEYRTQKLDFLSDAKQPDIYKKALQKYGDEIDTFANHGKPHENGQAIAFDVALKFIAGQHLPEIVADLNAEAEAKLAAKNEEMEARTKAAEQNAIRNIQQRGKAAPETATTGVPQTDTLSNEAMRMAIALGNDPKDVAKMQASINKSRKR